MFFFCIPIKIYTHVCFLRARLRNCSTGPSLKPTRAPQRSRWRISRMRGRRTWTSYEIRVDRYGTSVVPSFLSVHPPFHFLFCRSCSPFRFRSLYPPFIHFFVFRPQYLLWRSAPSLLPPAIPSFLFFLFVYLLFFFSLLSIFVRSIPRLSISSFSVLGAFTAFRSFPSSPGYSFLPVVALCSCPLCLIVVFVLFAFDFSRS